MAIGNPGVEVTVLAVDPGDVDITSIDTEKAGVILGIPVDPDGVGFVCTAVNAGDTNAEMLDSVEAPVVVLKVNQSLYLILWR